MGDQGRGVGSDFGLDRLGYGYKDEFKVKITCGLIKCGLRDETGMTHEVFQDKARLRSQSSGQPRYNKVSIRFKD